MKIILQGLTHKKIIDFYAPRFIRYALRFLLANNAQVLSDVLGVIARVISGYLIIPQHVSKLHSIISTSPKSNKGLEASRKA
jgi:hypothetical protein